MFISIFGYLLLGIGFLILALPLMLVELSRPRDWLMGGLFLFLGLFLLVESDFLRDSIYLLVIAMTILYLKMLLEIIQTRFYQLSDKEKKRIASYERWLESFKELAKILTSLVNENLNILKNFMTLFNKPLKQKKWVHPELKDEVKKKGLHKLDSADSNKMRNQKLPENE